MSLDSGLDALLHQLQSAAGVSQAASAAPPPQYDARGRQMGDDDDDDFMSDLQLLKRNNNGGNITSTATPSGSVRPVGGALTSMSTAEMLLHQCTRQHPLFLSTAERQAKEDRARRYAAGQLSGEEQRQYEMEDGLFAAQERVVATEMALAGDVASNHLHLRPASSTAVVALSVVNDTASSHDATSWRALIQEIRELPLVRTRAIWQRCVSTFPQQTEVVNEYLTKEIEHEATQARQSSGTEDPVVLRLRILDLFRRHVPLCIASAKLQITFVTYAAATGVLDPLTMKTVHEQAIARVRYCLDAAPLFQLAIDHMVRKQPKAVDAIRQLYQEWLKTPMDQLEVGEAAYSEYEKSLRVVQRIRLETSVEERFKRAKALYQMKSKLWDVIDPWYLPDKTSPFDPSVPAENPRRIAAQEQWRAWTNIVVDEADPERQKLPQAQHHRRFAFVLRQRLCYFPAVLTAWLDLARHCMATNTLHAVADAVFKEATTTHFPRSVFLHTQYAEFLSAEMNSPQRGNAIFVELLRRHIAAVNGVLSAARASSTGKPTAAQIAELNELKQAMTTTCCYWLSWARHALREKGMTHVRTVALHAIDKCQQGRSSAFLRHWLSIELQAAPVVVGDGVTAQHRAEAERTVGTVMSGWFSSIEESLSRKDKSAVASLQRHLDAATTAVQESTRRLKLRHAAATDVQAARARLLALVDNVIATGARAVAMVQSAACLVPEQVAADDAVAEAFRLLVVDVMNDRTTTGDAATGLSTVHAAGINTDFLASLHDAAARVPHLASRWRARIDALATPLKEFDIWLHDTLADVLPEVESDARDYVLRARLQRYSTDSAEGSSTENAAADRHDPAMAVVRLVVGGLRTDAALLARARRLLDVATPRFVPTDAPRDAASLRQASFIDEAPLAPTPSLQALITGLVERAMPVLGAWNPAAFPLGTTDRRLFASLIGLDMMDRDEPNERLLDNPDDEVDLSVSVLKAHRSDGVPLTLSTTVDPHRWQRLRDLPPNSNSYASVRDTGASAGGFQGGANRRGQRGGGGAAAAPRIPSADDVLRSAIEGQFLMLPNDDEDADLVRRKAVEESGNTAVTVHTPVAIATAGAGAVFYSASESPQGAQQAQATVALSRLLRALPAPWGCVEKFDAFIAARVEERWTESMQGAGTDADTAAVAGRVFTRAHVGLCPKTDYLMKVLATTQTMQLSAGGARRREKKA
jgi:hypothetical protein